MTVQNDVSISFSKGFGDWLEENEFNIFLSSYQAGMLFHIYSEHGAPKTNSIYLRSSMGLALTERALVAATSDSILFFNSFEDAEGCRHFVPRIAWFTGDLKTHEVTLRRNGEIWFANTRFNNVSSVDMTFSFSPVWSPSFMDGRANVDCCHLNGLYADDRGLRYVSAFSNTNQPNGWRSNPQGRGIVIDAESGEVCVSSLTMPHSPRVYNEKLWVLNSGHGSLGMADPDTGNLNEVLLCPGFARGLSFFGKYAFIGISSIRRTGIFHDLPLSERLSKYKVNASPGFVVADLEKGEIVHWGCFEGGVLETFDIAAIKHRGRINLVQPFSEEAKSIVLAKTGV